MNKQNQIHQDFIKAFKEKDEITKSALSSVKTKITEAEKNNSGKPLKNEDVMKIIASSIKQRQQSIEAFNSGGRHDLADKEEAEMIILQTYLPKQMTREEIETAAREIIQSMPGVETNARALIGKTIGTFNKKFIGQADMKTVQEVVKSIIEA